MGYSVAAAAAIVFTAIAISATQATSVVFDSLQSTHRAQDEGLRQAEAAARTEITVTSVTRNNGNGLVTVVADNTGSVTLDSREVKIVSNGVLLGSLSSVRVENSATKYAWAPGLELRVTYTSSSAITALAVIPETGTPGYWRA